MESFTIPRFCRVWVNLGVNLWILWLIKSMGGVVLRDSMLVFMKDVIEVIYGRKVLEKW